jgi:hypothetical protein
MKEPGATPQVRVDEFLEALKARNRNCKAKTAMVKLALDYFALSALGSFH